MTQDSADQMDRRQIIWLHLLFRRRRRDAGRSSVLPREPRGVEGNSSGIAACASGVKISDCLLVGPVALDGYHQVAAFCRSGGFAVEIRTA